MIPTFGTSVVGIPAMAEGIKCWTWSTSSPDVQVFKRGDGGGGLRSAEPFLTAYQPKRGTAMDLETLTVAVFCLVDDFVRDLCRSRKLRQRGPAPLLADSEVLTTEIVGEFLGLD